MGFFIGGTAFGIFQAIKYLDEVKAIDINCKYRGAIILEKRNFGSSHSTHYDLKYHEQILENIAVYDIDNAYRVGDTVDGSCR